MKGKLVGYAAVGTNDLERAKQFYDALLSEAGASSFSPAERAVFWQVKDGGSIFAVFKPFDESEARAGNGCMTGFPMDTKEQVDAMYAKAMELGASDEGEPGARTENFYGAYVRDLDGNKLTFYYYE